MAGGVSYLFGTGTVDVMGDWVEITLNRPFDDERSIVVPVEDIPSLIRALTLASRPQLSKSNQEAAPDAAPIR